MAIKMLAKHSLGTGMPLVRISEERKNLIALCSAENERGEACGKLCSCSTQLLGCQHGNTASR
jgi:hypothetical protein